MLKQHPENKTAIVNSDEAVRVAELALKLYNTLRTKGVAHDAIVSGLFTVAIDSTRQVQGDEAVHDWMNRIADHLLQTAHASLPPGTVFN